MLATCDKAVSRGFVQRFEQYVTPGTLLFLKGRRVHNSLSSTTVEETTPYRRHVRMLPTGVSWGFEADLVSSRNNPTQVGENCTRVFSNP